MLSLGIDLSEEKMDLTLLRESLRGPRLKAKARFYLPQGETTLAERRQYCAQKLRQFVAENRAPGAQIVVGLPRRHFLMRNLTIPSVRPEDVNRIMRYEADRHIPFEIGQVYYDTMAPESYQGPGSMDILFVGIRRQTMDELLEPVRIAGLRASVVDVSTFSSATTYLDRTQNRDATVAFVEIGEATLILSLLSGGRMRYSRAYALARMMQQHADNADPAASLAAQIAHELETLVHSAAMEPGEKHIDQLVVSGPGASSPQLVDSLETRLGLEAQLWAPLGKRANQSSGKSPDLSSEEAADMCRATSLALRGLSRSARGMNMLPEEQRIVRKDYGPHLAASLAALILLQAVMLYAHGLWVKTLESAALQQQVAELMPHADAVSQLRSELEALQTRSEELKKIEQTLPPRIALLAELTQHIPKEAWIFYMQIQKDELRLQVRSDPGLQIATRIGQSPYFRDAKLTQSTSEQLNIQATIQNPQASGSDAGDVEEEEGL
jgi:Tfp pilus assembly PilM family ATPase